MDGLTAVMLCLVTLVSLCVQVYSLGYMKGDVRFTWFYAVLSLFTAAMLNVVIANNLLQLLVGWEVMGVCSYLLIGHWWEEKTNSSAAIKAFLTTRVGDVPFLFGIFVLIAADRDLEHRRDLARRRRRRGLEGLLTAAALLLFGGAIGKSAQFPLHVWLPDAMAGPTPVSALIHAATMVAAGVYLVGRMFEVFIDADPGVLTFIAVIASITMLIAALMASSRTTSSASWRIPRSPSSRTWSVGCRSARPATPPASSICSPMASSRPCCSWARARSSTPSTATT